MYWFDLISYDSQTLCIEKESADDFYRQIVFLTTGEDGAYLLDCLYLAIESETPYVAYYDKESLYTMQFADIDGKLTHESYALLREIFVYYPAVVFHVITDADREWDRKAQLLADTYGPAIFIRLRLAILTGTLQEALVQSWELLNEFELLTDGAFTKDDINRLLESETVHCLGRPYLFSCIYERKNAEQYA